MNYKPGFTCIRSTAIGQTVAFSKKTGTVFCEDGTVCSPKEVQLFADAGEVIDLAVHTVKKVFGGEAAGVERNSGKYTAEEDTEAERIGETVAESGNNPLYEMRAKIFGNLCHNATKIFKALCGQMSPSRGFPLSARPPINK